MTRTRLLGVVAALVAAVAAVGFWQLTKLSSVPAAVQSRSSQLEPSTSRLAGPNEELGAPTVHAAASVSSVAFSLAAKVRELSSSSQPTDALRAYNILAECKWAREEELGFNLTREAERDPIQVKRFQSGEFAARLAQACGDLTAADQSLRLALAERAAVAGVPLAAIHLANEGPWGDFDALYTRPRDPQVLEWRQKVSGLIRVAAAKGDVAALTSLASQYSTGSGVIGELDPKLALQYAVAQNLVYEAQTGRTLAGRDKQLKDLSNRLSPEVAVQARIEGEKIAADALGRN